MSGEHDHESRMPLPDHIDAKAEDLAALVEGMTAFDHGAALHLDPIIAAAVLAFGFVYIHPFEDGNGRIHRYLIHHVSCRAPVQPAGPGGFRSRRRSWSRLMTTAACWRTTRKRLLPCVQWEPTDRGNVRVLNDTGDFYRFFDATPHAEFLYGCVRRTIEQDLPQETSFLRAYDAFCARVGEVVDMPANTMDLLFRFLQQNGGRLSQRAREHEFAALTDAEAERIERAYGDLFGAL